MLLEIVNLKKVYGDKVALNNLNFEMSPGIYGLLGPNGAGKSTFMNILVDAVEKTDGQILFDGKDIKKMGREYRDLIGYMPQQQGVYDDFTLEEFLGYIAKLKNIKTKEAKKRIEEVLQFVNLKERRKHKLKSFSGGMKQRALIAQAVLNDPKIIIFDEPTAGLDPKERIRIRNLISQISFNRIVIIATHIVSDIEFIANEILVLNEGNLIKKGSPEQLLHEIDDVVYEAYTDQNQVEKIMENYAVTSLSKDANNIRVRLLCDTFPEIECTQKVAPTLEDLYLHIFGE